MLAKIGSAALAIAMAVGLAACSGPGIPPPSGRGGQDDAEALVGRSVSAYDTNGPVVFTEISSPSKMYVDRDLYVYVIDPNRRIVASGYDPRLVGTDATLLVDASGTPIIDTMLVKADEDGEWVDYYWMDPISNTKVRRSSYVVLHDGYLFSSDSYPLN